MDSYQLNDLKITLNKQGANRFAKTSYPVRYGRFAEVQTPEYLFEYNLKSEIKTIRGLTPNWPHPAEWLKRTDANDWVFYSVARYHRLLSFLGEYYLPCLSYPSNSLWKYNPFKDTHIRKAFTAWSQLQVDLRAMRVDGFIELIRSCLDRFYSKGAVYLSPLNTSRNRVTLLRQFVEIKNKSRLPTYLYLIQRL